MSYFILHYYKTIKANNGYVYRFPMNLISEMNTFKFYFLKCYL